MSLKNKFDETRAASAKRRPPETRAIMQRATDDLRASGILATVTAAGQEMPAFAGVSYDGRAIELRRSSHARTFDPVVLPRTLVTVLQA